MQANLFKSTSTMCVKIFNLKHKTKHCINYISCSEKIDCSIKLTYKLILHAKHINKIRLLLKVQTRLFVLHTNIQLHSINQQKWHT